MEPYLLAATIAIILGVVALLLAKFLSERTPLQSRISLAIAAVALPAGLVFALLGIFALPPAAPDAGTPLRAKLKPVVLFPGDYPAGPLVPGSSLPPFEADGWLNDRLPVPVTGGQLLTVVDVWSLWNPSYRSTAPGLVETYHKYKDRRVAFVSLTNMPREGVQAFAKAYAIPWPCGYEAKSETLARFGAFNFNQPLRGYEVNLTIYLADAGGHVLWNDGQARMKSMAADPLVQQLDAQIALALAAAEKSEAKQ